MRSVRRARLLGWLVAGGGIVLGSGGTAQAQAGSYFTSWQAIDTTTPQIVQNGGKLISVGWAENSDPAAPPNSFQAVIQSNTTAGLPTGIESRGWGLSKVDPALTWVSVNGYALDYLLMDIEGDTAANHQTIYDNVARVRNDLDPGVSEAHVGNYAYYPGISQDTSGVWPSDYGAAFKVQRETVYAASGLDVAMPVAYNSSQLALHCAPAHNGVSYVDGTAPTPLAAIFWGGLETVSVAARSLTPGHLLIPYIADFINQPNYGVPQSEVLLPVDNAAQVQHYRMRGAAGFRTWQVNSNQSGTPTYYFQTYGNVRDATLAYSTDMATAWQALDPLFTPIGDLRYLNRNTNKSAGIQWSGVQKGNRSAVLVSNLNTPAQQVNWTSAPALPTASPQVAYRQHVALRYRSDVMDRLDFEGYAFGSALNAQGSESWVGPNPNMFNVTTPPGTGNASPKAVVSTGGYNSKIAWKTVAAPNFASTDKVVYSGRLFNGISGVGFEVMNPAGASPAGRAAYAYQGPLVSMNWGSLRVRDRFDAGDVYQAVNIPATMNKWFEVKLVVDASSGPGRAALFARNLTDGQAEFTRVVFDNINTTGVTERVLYVPMTLGANNNPSNMKGIVASVYGDNNALDNVGMGYHAPDISDNLEHYQLAVTMNAQTTPELVWNGSTTTGPNLWTTVTPAGTGNGSAIAVAPTTATSTRAWWKTERPDYKSSEPVVYSGRLYGTGSVSFAPVNTAASAATGNTPNANVGFLVQFEQTQLRLRGSRDSGELFKATNFTPTAGKWYEIQVQVDPTRDIDGVAGGTFGAARVWVKNLTDNTAPVLVSFDKVSTVGTVEALAEVPLQFNGSRNVTVLDGWEVGAVSSAVQIDQLRSRLYPYADFVNKNQFIAD